MATHQLPGATTLGKGVFFGKCLLFLFTVLAVSLGVFFCLSQSQFSFRYFRTCHPVSLATALCFLLLTFSMFFATCNHFCHLGVLAGQHTYTRQPWSTILELDTRHDGQRILFATELRSFRRVDLFRHASGSRHRAQGSSTTAPITAGSVSRSQFKARVTSGCGHCDIGGQVPHIQPADG